MKHSFGTNEGKKGSEAPWGLSRGGKKAEAKTWATAAGLPAGMELRARTQGLITESAWLIN